MNESPAFTLSSAWPVIEADDLVKCEDCRETGYPRMKPCLEPHGEETNEPVCTHCGSSWIYRWPQD